MVTTILGRKLGMTQVWSEDDRLLPVTVIEAGPCVVTQVKTDKTDGYRAIQIGFGDIAERKVNKPMHGHFDKAGVEPKRHLMEIRLGDEESVKVGSTITVDAFAEAKSVHVTGVSKGKGFAGVMKRHNFKGGPGGHGSHSHRVPGSVGQCATPARIFRGKKMPGHMGSEVVTVRNLDLVKIDSEQNLLIVKGAVPGGKGALLTIRMA
ncbi:MAG: 50S ribosomal protein L3 [Actinobacteria bacterium HGW-Actinobacteria-7]|jgi:large subunit ribosomal protein L3|nr:MAG: 50S ribosomal protein L3 [Actinobacteria bacterium HGW-Actinobacteria-7]